MKNNGNYFWSDSKPISDETIDIWYLDEMGIEGDPRPRRHWAQKGAKIRVPYYGEYLRMNVTGLVGPRTGQFYALEFTHTDSEVFQVFLDHANQDVKLERPRNILICDNAGLKVIQLRDGDG